MTEQWENHKWIFEPDGSLLDIYVRDANLNDWLTLIDFLNDNYKLKFVPTSTQQTENKIDKDYIRKMLLDNTGELERRTVSIYTNDLVLNCHFFLQDQIEFDANPKEFKGQENFKTIIVFMKSISKLLNKEIILTGENRIDFPLITVNTQTDFLKITTEGELKQQHDNSLTLTGRIRGYYVFSLVKLIPKLNESKFKKWLTDYVIGLTGASKPYVATKRKR